MVLRIIFGRQYRYQRVSSGVTMADARARFKRGPTTVHQERVFKPGRACELTTRRIHGPARTGKTACRRRPTAASPRDFWPGRTGQFSGGLSVPYTSLGANLTVADRPELAATTTAEIEVRNAEASADASETELTPLGATSVSVRACLSRQRHQVRGRSP